MIYLDIETYSQQKEPSFEDKVIAIEYKEVDGKSELLKEWESDEKTILSKFYKYLKEKLRIERSVMIIGFNLLLFDRDFLAVRLYFHTVDELANIFNNFKKIYWKDLRYCLLPFNKFSFVGLSAEELARKLGIRMPKYSNKDIRSFYDNREYEKIVEHVESDMKFLSDLSFKMNRDLSTVVESLTK